MSWDKVRLGDICTKIGSGSTPKGGSSVYQKRGISFIRSQNVYNLAFDIGGLVFINEQAAEKLNGVTLEENDVLLNITGDSVARTCMVPKSLLPARVNQHVAIVRPSKEKLDPFFLMYYLASPFMQSYMLNLAVGKGASRNAMTKEMIENFEIPCPHIDIQKKIINVLRSSDNLIMNNQKQIKLLEESAHRLYKEWFVDLRFPGYETVKIIEGLPEGWKKDKAECFYKISIGKTPPRTENQWFVKGEEGIPWLSITDMGNAGVFAFKTNECLTEEAIQKYNIKKIPQGTIVVSFKLTVGRVAIAATDMCTNEAIAHFYMEDENQRAYTYCYLNNYEYETLGNTSSISRAVNSKIIKSMPFVVPSDNILEKFSHLVTPILRDIRVKQKINNNLVEARDRLLPKLMSGEITI